MRPPPPFGRTGPERAGPAGRGFPEPDGLARSPGEALAGRGALAGAARPYITSFSAAGLARASGSAFAGIVALVWLGERLFDVKLLPL